jgi:hypothetical protein
VLAVFNAAPFIDQFIQSKDQTYVMREKYDVNAMLDYVTWDYGYADTDFKALAGTPAAVAASDAVEIANFKKRGTHVTFDYTADTGQTVTLPLYFYPGYAAALDGAQELEPIDGDNHLLALSLPAGEGSVAVYYKGFWYFNAANFVSLFTALVLAGWGFCKRRRAQ